MNGINSHPTDAQTLDTAFSLMRNERRRHVVSVLSERGSPIAFRELVTAVATLESGTERDDVSADLTGDLAIELYHLHLPKLDSAGVVDFDPGTNAVVSARTEEFTPLLESSHTQ